jgi:hypothetical protein
MAIPQPGTGMHDNTQLLTSTDIVRQEPHGVKE